MPNTSNTGNTHEQEQESLFAAVDALLEEAAQDPLPHPDERKRLREAAGLSQDQIAKALAVRRETVTSWETGRTSPRPPKRAAYARLLEGLTALHPVNGVNAVNAAPIPATAPEAHAPQPKTEPQHGEGTPRQPTPHPTAEAHTAHPVAPVNGVNATPPLAAATAATTLNAIAAPTAPRANTPEPEPNPQLPEGTRTDSAVNPPEPGAKPQRQADTGTATPQPPTHTTAPRQHPAPATTPPPPQPTTTPTTPQPGPATPQAETGTPQTGPHTPQAGPRTPQTEPHTSQAGPRTPLEGTGTPQTEPHTFQAGPRTPLEGTGTPQTEPHTSQAGPRTPLEGTGTPLEGTGTPQAGTGTSQAGPRTPQTGPHTPLQGNGPLAVLTGTGQAHTTAGLILDHPTTGGLPALLTWALTEANLRSPRLHRNGKDGDPLLVLTAPAVESLGLPLTLEDRRALRLPDNHPTLKQLAKNKWQLTRRGFGPWPRIYRPATPTTGRQCVQLAILPWGALDPRAWGEDTATLPAPELAELLTTYAARVLTPRGSTAVTGLELMTALRPPTRAARDEATNTWVSAPVPGSLTRPVDPAPPEAPDEHPVVASLYPRSHQRTPDQVLDEEAYDWIRDPQLLTDAECARTHAVGIDVNMAFAAAANRLVVGLGPATHTTSPRFDPKLPGCWLADLSSLDVELDPRLPNPFTPHGKPPTGPAWYATPTLAYAQELGHDVRPTEAWIRPDNGPYLDAWYTRLRDAYMATMADLGVTPSLTEPEFLKAMSTHKQDPEAATGTRTQISASVLSAIKSTVKGGIGKLRERPQGAAYRPGEPWPALERPTWRPDIRAAVISTARVNMHRKMLKLARTADLHPIAVLSDCAVYLSDGPSPLDFLPHTPDGKPLPGGFRLGVNPGMVKHEGTQPLLWAVQMLDEGLNPARHIKGHDAAAHGE
ncbi:telomere-associated protein Tap [Streptomyces sp. NPDC048337]|uniref:telomere-associated protein Tap n=1 Tax=Streptomyces sp. NPDC048337 TaxID=3365535 RepID=UPI003716FC1C